MKKHVFVNNKEFEFEIEDKGNKKRIIYRNKEFEVEIINKEIDGRMFAIINGEGVEFSIFRAGKDRYTILMDGNEYEVETGKKREKREDEEGNIIYAPMPGIITEIKGKKGERVKKGTPLLAMESMKMQIEISSPTNGEIEVIFVEKGSSVKKGDKLIKVKNG